MKRLGSKLNLPELSPRKGDWANVIGEAVKRERLSLKEAKQQSQETVISGYVGAMVTNAAHAAVQEESMVALCHIISSGHSLRTLVNAGGIDAVVAAMR